MAGPTIWVSFYEGTGGDFDLDKIPSVFEQFRRVLRTPGRENKVKLTTGVGSPYSLGEKFIGGGLGLGIDRKVLANYQYLTNNAGSQDSCIAGGGSRGADAARRELGVIERVGLPNDPKDCKILYKLFMENKLNDREECARLMVRYNCRKIKILALLTIDTVCSYGVPRTGPYLSQVPKLHKVHDTRPIIAPKGSYLKLHAVALGDNRTSFLPLLMHNPPEAEQQDRPINMYFSGAHSDILYGPLSLLVLGWFVSRLDDLHEVTINHQELRIIFPGYGTDSRTAWEAACKATAHQSYKGLYKFAGYSRRVPGKLHNQDFTVNQLVYPSVRARNYGLTYRDEAIFDHRYVVDHPAGPGWANKHAATVNAGDEMGGPVILKEAQLHGLEARLWGFAPVEHALSASDSSDASENAT